MNQVLQSGVWNHSYCSATFFVLLSRFYQDQRISHVIIEHCILSAKKQLYGVLLVEITPETAQHFWEQAHEECCRVCVRGALCVFPLVVLKVTNLNRGHIIYVMRYKGVGGRTPGRQAIIFSASSVRHTDSWATYVLLESGNESGLTKCLCFLLF